MKVHTLFPPGEVQMHVEKQTLVKAEALIQLVYSTGFAHIF